LQSAGSGPAFCQPNECYALEHFVNDVPGRAVSTAFVSTRPACDDQGLPQSPGALASHVPASSGSLAAEGFPAFAAKKRPSMDLWQGQIVMQDSPIPMPSRRARPLGTSLTKCSRGVAFVRLAKGGAAASALQMLEWPRTSHFYGQTEGGNDESISSRVRNGDVRIFSRSRPVAWAQGHAEHLMVAPKDLTWADVPSLPPGAKIAVIEGPMTRQSRLRFA